MIKYDVNIDLANNIKQEISTLLNTDKKHILSKPNSFACLFELDLNKYKNPVLVFKTEEPGSKQLIAAQYDRIEGVCYDMINHLVNDCIVMGATPLLVQDAIICGKMDDKIVGRIVKAISNACLENECILTGGETSEQPSVLGDDSYILTSSIIGVVEKDSIIDGSNIVDGDIVIGLPSSGVHTNGYTLIRSLMAQKPEILDIKINNMNFIEAILVPHLSYYKSLKGLFGSNSKLKGMAHITGGGIKENLNRILPENLNAIIDLNQYDIPEVFKTIRSFGKVSDPEMLRTFNMGVGLALVVSPEDLGFILSHFAEFNIQAKAIGKITKGNQTVECVNSFNW